MPLPNVTENELDGEYAIVDTVADYHGQLKPLMALRASLAPGNNPSSVTVQFGAASVTITKAALIEDIRQALRGDVGHRARAIMAEAKSLRQS